MSKVIVAHPNKQHSFFTATGVKESGLLFKYITTVYDRPGAITYTAKKLLKGKNLKRANGRHCDKLDDSDVIQFNEMSCLISLAMSKVPRLNKIREKHRRKMCDAFGVNVAKYAIKNNVDAVVMYDSTALSCFSYLKKHAPQIKCILDVSIATRQYMQQIFNKDIEETGIEDIKREQWLLWDQQFLDMIQKEVDYSDYFLAPSQFVKKSLRFCGAREDQIKIVPYGVDIKLFPKRSDFDVADNKPLELIYVGFTSYRKGIHHLLNVVKQYTKDELKITLCGDYDRESPLYKDYCDAENIDFAGFVTRDQLAEKYQAADAFVLFTLGEGLAQVGEEALACGVPLITTEYSGVNDLVENGKNGFVVDFSEKALKERFDWCIANRQALRGMTDYARQTAEKYSMENYYRSVGRAVEEIVKGE